MPNKLKASPNSGDRAPIAVAVRYRTLGFAALCVLSLAFLAPLVRNLVALLSDETYTHIPLIPVISAFLIYLWRDSIFHQVSHAWLPGGTLSLVGMVCLGAARFNALRLSSANQTTLLMFGFVLLWLGLFLLFFGTPAFRAGLFPLLFLLFMVPIPEPLLGHIIWGLQAGSSTAAEWMFRMTGIPYLREGFDFALPGVTIRVAEECSGIRSSLALVILTVLAAELFLQKRSHRLWLCLLTIPLSIIKNGFRVATLSALAIYVDPSYLTGPLHHRGGVVFFSIALVPLFLFLKYLQYRESKIGPRVSLMPPLQS